MEAWKVHKFCEGASLKELLERKEKLSRLIEQNHLSRTNADQVMGILEEYIDLKTLFDED